MKGYTWQYRHHAWAIWFFFSKYVFFRMEGCRGKAYPTCLPDPFFHFRPGTWWNSGSCRAPQEKRLCGERWLGTQPCKPWVCNQNPRFRIEPLIFLGYWGLRYIVTIFVFFYRIHTLLKLKSLNTSWCLDTVIHGPNYGYGWKIIIAKIAPTHNIRRYQKYCGSMLESRLFFRIFSVTCFCVLGSGSVQQHDWWQLAPRSRLFVVFPGEKPLVAEAVFVWQLCWGSLVHSMHVEIAW